MCLLIENIQTTVNKACLKFTFKVKSDKLSTLSKNNIKTSKNKPFHSVPCIINDKKTSLSRGGLIRYSTTLHVEVSSQAHKAATTCTRVCSW